MQSKGRYKPAKAEEIIGTSWKNFLDHLEKQFDKNMTLQNHGMEVALERARMYNDCGPDGFLIHSKKKTPDEIFRFADEYHKAGLKVPLVCVPTTYNEVTIDELQNVGYSLVIYANYSIRAAVKSIENIFTKILEEGTLSAANNDVVDMEKIFELIRVDKLKDSQERYGS